MRTLKPVDGKHCAPPNKLVSYIALMTHQFTFCWQKSLNSFQGDINVSKNHLISSVICERKPKCFSKFYEQSEVCKLADCPIDGGWGKWEEWGR